MKQTTYSLLALTVLSLFAASASAQTIVNFENIDRLDSSKSWAPKSGDSSTTHALVSGASSTNNGDVFVVALNFDLTGLSTQIQSATAITFEIDYTWASEAQLNIELLGFGKIDSTVVAEDATAVATSAGIKTGFTTGGGSSGTTVLGTLSYDVTSIVQSMDTNGFTFAGFRIVAPDKMPGPSDGSGDVLGFYRYDNIPEGAATLTIIPEPGTFALFAGLATFALVSCRRKV